MTAATCPILVTAAGRTEALLDQALPPADLDPASLHEAMRYAVLGGGKRVRPALVLAAGRAAGGSDPACEPAMTAVELLHTYTLVHDDLPAMDDDDLRRGRPTVHRAWDEATAILVGDALQTLAFETIADAGAEAVRTLARATGSRGVVGGQQRDLDATGRISPTDPAATELVARIHADKTAALIRCCCELGAIAAGCSAAAREALTGYGSAMGHAFQIVDDLLDRSGSAADLGKTPGKDVDQAKLTYVAVHGPDRARRRLDALQQEAEALLAPFGSQADDLLGLGRFIIERSH